MKYHLKITTLIYLGLYSITSFVTWEVLTPLTTLKALPDMESGARMCLLVLIAVINLIPFMSKDIKTKN